MEIVEYLNQYFYTREELLQITHISDEQLTQWQSASVMPKASYQLKLNAECNSFFGYFNQLKELEYYAKGYASWLGMLQTTSDPLMAFTIFKQRYEQTIAELKEQGHSTKNQKLCEHLAEHVQQEWQHFLSGTYGLCTRSGLPADIAAKELAIAEISELTEHSELNPEQRQQLTSAVNLLDQASALFAPHERERSSRFRLIDEVRRRYQLT